MKKLITLLAIALLALSSSNAFATAAATSGVSNTDAQTLFGGAPADLDIAKSSTGVYFGWATGSTGYAVTTYHSSGTKFYGTAYDSTALYFDDVGTVATTALATSLVPSDSASANAFPSTSWTEM